MRALIAAFIITSLSACNPNAFSEPQMLDVPKKPGQILDPNSSFVKTWPGKPSLVKLKDNLVLSIPPQHHQFWTQRHWITGVDSSNRPPMTAKELPYAPSAGFMMHMPDFGGFTYENYLKEFDEDMVEIWQIAPASMDVMKPGAVGRYPPNMFERITTKPYQRFDPEIYEEKFGLRCSKNTGDPDNKHTCWGIRDSNLKEMMLLDVSMPPNPNWMSFPLMKTIYFSPQYGGVEIGWRAHVKHLPRWREIDAQIWKYIDHWNIATQRSDAHQTMPQK